MKHLRLLVTGSRDFSDEIVIASGLADVVGRYGNPAVTLVHGDARGVDKTAAAIGKRLGWNIEKYPADWVRWGNAAGPIRNQIMVDTGAEVCVAFKAEGSKGTADCIKRAKRAGIRVFEYAI